MTEHGNIQNFFSFFDEKITKTFNEDGDIFKDVLFFKDLNNLFLLKIKNEIKIQIVIDISGGFIYINCSSFNLKNIIKNNDYFFKLDNIFDHDDIYEKIKKIFTFYILNDKKIEILSKILTSYFFQNQKILKKNDDNINLKIQEKTFIISIYKKEYFSIFDESDKTNIVHGNYYDIILFIEKISSLYHHESKRFNIDKIDIKKSCPLILNKKVSIGLSSDENISGKIMFFTLNSENNIKGIYFGEKSSNFFIILYDVIKQKYDADDAMDFLLKNVIAKYVCKFCNSIVL